MKTALIRSICLSGVLLSAFIMPLAHAVTFAVPDDGGALIGRVTYHSPSASDTLLNIGLRQDLGLNEMVDANPDINPVNPLPNTNTTVVVPNEFLLPALTHSGIIINLPEMRMYYYPKESQGVVMTYPIGIGRIGKTIPIQRTAVLRKKENPSWYPTPDIRAFNEKQGIVLPKIMGPGPDNPLGPYAIYLHIPTFLIHSTIFPDSVGRRASFGCIRMHENDIKEFFPLITPGVSVTIVDMPNKLGWARGQLYLESHEPLEERENVSYATLDGVVSSVEKATHNQLALVDWQLVSEVYEDQDGIPHQVGVRITR